jgi:hypothetical protein
MVDDDLVQYLGSTYGNSATVPPTRGAIYMGDFVKAMKQVRPEMFTAAAKDKYATGGLNQWLQQSSALRDGFVYPDGRTQMASVKKGEELMHRTYCAWYANQDSGVLGKQSPEPAHISASAMPLLDEESYAKPNAKIVETQMLIAGVRLAAILDRIAMDASPSQPTKYLVIIVELIRNFHDSGISPDHIEKHLYERKIPMRSGGKRFARSYKLLEIRAKLNTFRIVNQSVDY